MKFRHVNFSDIHFGACDPKLFYENELVPLLEAIADIENLGIVTSAGELYDKRVHYDDPVVTYSHKFINDLRDICYRKSAALALCAGTRSHEGNQYDLLKSYEDIYIYDDVGILKVDGVSFRFIPDLAYDNYTIFKDRTFTSKVDITVMHGLIEGAIPVADILSTHTRKKDITVRVKDLQEYTRLYTVAGHVHKRMNIASNIWYTGATRASSYKDANIKRFGIDNIEVYDDDYRLNFIHNKYSPIYRTENMTHLFTETTMEKVKGNLLLHKRSLNENDHVRIDIEEKYLTANDLAIFRSVKSLFSDTFDFNLLVDTEGKESIISKIEEESAMVLDSSITVEEKAHIDIQDNRDVKYDIKTRMTLDRINDLINLDIEELMIIE